MAMDSDFLLTTCLELCRVRLEDWNKLEFGHVGKTIAEL